MVIKKPNNIISFQNAANLADKVLEVYNEKRRDMVWVSFVLTCITLPIFVFCVDVYSEVFFCLERYIFPWQRNLSELSANKND